MMVSYLQEMVGCPRPSLLQSKERQRASWRFFAYGRSRTVTPARTSGLATSNSRFDASQSGNHIDTGHHLEQLAGEVWCGSVAGRRHIDFARVGLGIKAMNSGAV
jgi:hypothetical protein